MVMAQDDWTAKVNAWTTHQKLSKQSPRGWLALSSISSKKQPGKIWLLKISNSSHSILKLSTSYFQISGHRFNLPLWKKITFPNWGEVAAHENFQDIREHSPPGTPKNQTILDDDEVMLKWEMTEMKLMVMSHDMTSIYTFLLVLDPVGCSLMSHDMTSIYTFLLVLDPVGCSLFSMTCLSRNQANLCWFLDIFLLDFFLRFGHTFHALFVDEVFHQELNEGAEPWPHELFHSTQSTVPCEKNGGLRIEGDWTVSEPWDTGPVNL